MKTALTAIMTALVMTTPVAAQDVCMSALEMQSSLIDWYGEKPVSGPSQDNTRLWVSDATGSWTLVRTQSDGIACVEAQGRNWTAGMDAEEIIASIQARTDS